MKSRPGPAPEPTPGPEAGRPPSYPHLLPEAHLHLQVPVSEPDPIVGEDRILTVPNLITLARLLCLPLYLWLLLSQDDRVAAAALLAVLGATDWADGYVARHFNQVSSLGKVFDPVADRILFLVAVGGIIAVDGAPRWFSIAVLAREVVISGAALALAASGARRIEVTWVGKAGTFGREADRGDLGREGRDLRADGRLPALPGRHQRPRRRPPVVGPGVGRRHPGSPPRLLGARHVPPVGPPGPARGEGRAGRRAR
jgi:phosphatidylglycerophosphate synthase